MRLLFRIVVKFLFCGILYQTMKLTGIKDKIGGILEKLREFCSSIKGSFSALFTKITSLFSSSKRKEKQSKNLKSPAKDTGFTFFAKLGNILSSKVDLLKNRFLELVPANKRRPVLFAFGGLLALLIIFIIGALSLNSIKPKESGSAPRIAGIPHEELFYPAEPDSLPDFLLERDPRRFWTADDIRPYWRPPAYSEFWQREIKASIDKLMEGVP